LWTPGAIYADQYAVEITKPIDPRSPLQARIYTGFIDPATAATTKLPLQARNAKGDIVTPIVATTILAPDEATMPVSNDLQPVGSTFGSVIKIDAAGVPENITLANGAVITTTILWEAAGQPATDYTAYIHLLDSSGRQVAGFDRAPADTRFPTSAWRAGDRVLSEVPLTLPEGLAAGNYELWAGLYESSSGGAMALPVSDAGDAASKDGQVQLGVVKVQP
jgi:hypothetical protein